MYTPISSLDVPSICDEFSRPFTSLEAPQHYQIRSAGGTYGHRHIPASAHGLLQRSLRSRFADHSLRLPTLQALRNCIDEHVKHLSDSQKVTNPSVLIQHSPGARQHRDQTHTSTAPPPLMVCFALASLALRRPFAPANNTF